MSHVRGVFLLCLVLFLINGGITQDYMKLPASDFSRHSIVHPVIQHGRTKREIVSRTHAEGLYHPELTIKLNLDGEENVIDLVLNKDLISKDHAIVYQKNGSILTYKPSIEELDLCQYSGKVRGKKDSWVALSTCHGVRGVIHDGEQMKHIEPAQVVDPQIGSKHYVYDHLDLTTKFFCGDQGRSNNSDHDHEHFNDQSTKRRNSHRYKRSVSNETEVRGPFKVNKKSRFVELVLVADNAVYKANGENIHHVHKQMKDIANIMNSLFAQLNVFITLVGVEVWTEDDKISINHNGDETLTNFLRYRRDTLNNRIPNDNALLLTMQRFTGEVIGKFLKGPICTSEYSGGVAMNNSVVIGLVATNIAHGLGHNFGMEHDTGPSCECFDDKCIMTPIFSSVAPTRWSLCSRDYLARAFERGMDHCLRNKPKRLFDSPTCGNGFVEAGEQCDCGLKPLPACSACCETDTCMLRSNASCASGECCDTRTCKLHPASTVCRSAEADCDLPEYCTGDSEFCPKDVHKMDATPCSNNEAYCAQGLCRTHTDQCRLLWGPTGLNSDALCYDNNIKGNRRGNCGVLRLSAYEKLYDPCALQHVQCGLLQCKHRSERLEYGMESVSILSATFINSNGSIIPCRTAIIDLGTRDVDPGLVPDGAKCGEDKMCLKQKCVSVLAVREQMSRRESSVCPSDCSGHGVCNSEGHCHCNAGYAPPLCAEPGDGGSVDSGPAQYPANPT